MGLLGPLLVAGLGLALVLVAGCGAAGRQTAQHTRASVRPRAPELSTVALTARIGRDVVRSSGVVFDPSQGLVLSSAGALWGARSVKVATGLGVVFGRIVARDACVDLSVVQLVPWLPGLTAFATSTTPPGPGAQVTVLARRWTAQGPRTPAVVARATVAAPRGNSGRPRLRSPLPGYATGAAVLDAQGRLVGLVGGSGDATRPDSVVTWRSASRRLARLRHGRRVLYVGWRAQYRCAPRLERLARAHPGYRPIDARLSAPVPATRLPGTSGVDG